MAGNHVLLETIALTQNATSVTFDNIPQTGYTDLKVVTSTRLSNTDSPILVNFNGVTTGYSWRRIYGNGSSASSLSGSDAYFLHGNTSSTTANTFSNAEFYVPNYTVSQPKSISVDTALETNATGGELFMLAALWNNNAAVTSIVLTPLTGSFVAGSTFSIYGVAAFGTTPTVAPKATGGNIVANDGTYWYHAFTSSGNFVPQTELTCDAIVIGAGGSGGGDVGGGAGAGRLYALSSLAMVTGTNYTCTVGAGGASPVGNASGVKGTDSSLIGGLLSYTALAGGGGTGRVSYAANDGWNGGGGSYNLPNGLAGNGGFAGGNTVNPGSNPTYSGGGGGASEAGNTDGTGQGGDGVNTYSSWATATNTGVSGFYAGGGGGGMYGSDTSNAAGGDGGGGFGGDNNQGGANGVASTGSGGGGAGSSQTGGSGGSGIVIIRYPMAS